MKGETHMTSKINLRPRETESTLLLAIAQDLCSAAAVILMIGGCTLLAFAFAPSL